MPAGRDYISAQERSFIKEPVDISAISAYIISCIFIYPIEVKKCKTPGVKKAFSCKKRFMPTNGAL
jgi:hypothetical protein